MSLPPIAAVPRLQPRKQQPRAPAKPSRRGRGAPPEQQPPPSRAPTGSRSSAAPPAEAPPALSRGRSAAATPRFSLSLPPEAVRVLQRRSLEKQPQPRAASPDVAKRIGDRRALLKVSLLNERHRYDDVEYEEDEAGADEALVRRCTEWLRGVESATARHQLDTLPHLSTL